MQVILRRLFFYLLFGATSFAIGQPPDPSAPDPGMPSNEEADEMDSEYGPVVESGTGPAHEGSLPTDWSDDDWTTQAPDDYGDGDGGGGDGFGDGVGDGCPA